MSMSEDDMQNPDTALEELLGKAGPRPTPSAEAVDRARLAVQGEWQAVVGQKARRRRMRLFATAAGVVLAVALLMNAVLAPRVVPVQIATVEKTAGAIYFLGEQSELHRTDNLSAVMTGQTIVTGDDATIGLHWGLGGYLRLDQNTEIEFVAADRVELASGRIYFDSITSGAEVSSEAQLTIITEHGDVRHIGTQYMMTIDNRSLIVSVREGRVAIDGHYHDEIAVEGEELTVSGSARPGRTNITGFGEAWEWIELAAPATDTKGITLQEFLDWVSRETGLKFELDDAAARSALTQTLKGDVADEASEALRQGLHTFDLIYKIEDGVIHISQSE